MFDPNLDAGRLGEVIENLRWLALGELSAIKINADMDATIGGARERLHDWPVRQDIRPCLFHARRCRSRQRRRVQDSRPAHSE
jgi:hypothetical protein